jgi:protein-tyrosine phosphatase
VLTDAEAVEAINAGVTAVLDLTAEFSESQPFRTLRYLNLPILDLTAPTQEQLAAAVEFIKSEPENGIVYVHCKIGYSRSAAAVAAYLLDSGLAVNAEAALAHLRAVRPGIVVRPEAWRAVEVFRSPHSGGRLANGTNESESGERNAY